MVVVDEAERDVGTREREADHIVADLARLGRIRLEKFLARGRVEKKLLHAHSRSDLTARVLDLGRLAAEYVDTCAEVVRCLPREEREARDGCNRRQRLAAKAEGRNRLQVRNSGDLACRMAQDCRLCVRARHTAPVVRDANKADAAAHNFDFDGGCTRIHRVLDEFLDDGGGTLHDLARRNLVDGRVVQYTNRGHASPASFRACSCKR